MNSKGQYFEGYELLIGAIMALLILVIIFGFLSQLRVYQEQASLTAYFDGVKSAVSSPNGEIFQIKSVMLPAGTYNGTALEKQTTLKAECFSFQAPEWSNLHLNDLGDVEIVQSSEIAVFAKCVLADDYGSGCKESCLISFGKEID